MGFDWLRPFHLLVRSMRKPAHEEYLREHERERELEMQQIREMTGAAPGRAGDAPGDRKPKT